MRMHRQLPLLLAALAFLAGSTGGEAATLRVTRDGPIFPVFHPVRATDNTYPILYMLYSNLVHLEADEKTVIPDLADSWTASEDATKFTFKLNEDAAWQDGTDLRGRRRLHRVVGCPLPNHVPRPAHGVDADRRGQGDRGVGGRAQRHSGDRREHGRDHPRRAQRRLPPGVGGRAECYRAQTPPGGRKWRHH